MTRLPYRMLALSRFDPTSIFQWLRNALQAALNLQQEIARRAIPVAAVCRTDGLVIDPVEEIVDVERDSPVGANAIRVPDTLDDIESLDDAKWQFRPYAVARGAKGIASRTAYIVGTLRDDAATHARTVPTTWQLIVRPQLE